MEHGTTVPGLEFEAPIVELEAKIRELRSFSQTTDVDLSGQIEELEHKCAEKTRAIYSRLTPWQKVQIARHPDRPGLGDYVKFMCVDFLELHGDRGMRDDPAILTGLGRIGQRRFMVVGHRKGKTTREKLETCFGCAHPEGYRKALQKMKFAEKFALPIVTFINTPGAFPGIEAEERGQAFIIARNLMEMAALRVPVISVVIGEGGSGGALGIGVADRLLMLEHSYYSVISPEGCAAILWGDASHAARSSEILKLTAQDLDRFDIVDEVIPEPVGGAHRGAADVIRSVEEAILRHHDDIRGLDPEERLEKRFEKYHTIGAYLEEQDPAGASQ